jgi:hypothetical protein
VKLGSGPDPDPDAVPDHWILIVIDFGIHCLTIYDSWQAAYCRAEKVSHWRHSSYFQQIQVFVLYTMDDDIPWMMVMMFPIFSIQACQKWLECEFKRRGGKVQPLEWSQWDICITPKVSRG